jgi:gamma-glutamylcysteine synthetase
MVGKANSLVIFDIKGFHRRGVFQDNRLREILETRYLPGHALVTGPAPLRTAVAAFGSRFLDPEKASNAAR